MIGQNFTTSLDRAQAILDALTAVIGEPDYDKGVTVFIPAIKSDQRELLIDELVSLLAHPATVEATC